MLTEGVMRHINCVEKINSQKLKNLVKPKDQQNIILENTILYFFKIFSSKSKAGLAIPP